MLELGWNYRMTELQAALGCSQMRRLPEFVARRRALADRYDRLLADSGLSLPRRSRDCESAWHLYVIGWNAERSGKSRKTAFEALRAAGVGVNVHYIPVHLQPYYRRFGFAPGQFPVAERYYENALTIPLYAGMSDADQDRVVAALFEVLGR
jgi:dTDP-4-amino-4,6-dideoxygalactose transaminase